MRFFRKVVGIVLKDILLEVRTKEVAFSVLMFTLLVAMVFNFSFGASEEIRQIFPGILWATFIFAGVLNYSRSFASEKEEGCLGGLKVCPVSHEAIYIGKMLSSLLFMLIIEAIALPIFAFLFDLPLISSQVIAVVFSATVGLAALGTLFSALSINTKAREMALPILLFPVIVPIIISAVKAMELAFAGASWGRLSSWLEIIGAFDVIFMIISLWTFPFLIED